MNPAETLEVVLSALEEAGVEYMLTGSIAGSYHGVPRTTQDIDLVVDGSGEDLLAFARSMSQQGFYVSEDAVGEAVEIRGQFSVIDPRTAWKIDLILRRDRGFSRTEFERRTQEEALGMRLWMATAEDVILAKLEWAGHTGSERQMEDVVGIIGSQGVALDRPYIERWSRELGIEAEWEQARDRAGGEP